MQERTVARRDRLDVHALRPRATITRRPARRPARCATGEARDRADRQCGRAPRSRGPPSRSMPFRSPTRSPIAGLFHPIARFEKHRSRDHDAADPVRGPRSRARTARCATSSRRSSPPRSSPQTPHAVILPSPRAGSPGAHRVGSGRCPELPEGYLRARASWLSCRLPTPTPTTNLDIIGPPWRAPAPKAALDVALHRSRAPVRKARAPTSLALGSRDTPRSPAPPRPPPRPPTRCA